MNSPLIKRRDLVKGLSLLPLAPLLYQGTRSSAAPALPQATAPGPNVLIVVFDTVSAPHMS